MKALTVQQPWAWAIVHGGKDVENRTQAWTYRGPVAIHAGRQGSKAGFADDRFLDAFRRAWGATTTLEDLRDSLAGPLVMGSVMGVVDLVDVHRADGLEADPWEWCCKPWGEGPGVTLKPDGTCTGPTTHLVLENPRPLAEPIPCRGQLGLWTPPADLTAAINQQLEEA